MLKIIRATTKNFIIQILFIIILFTQYSLVSIGDFEGIKDATKIAHMTRKAPNTKGGPGTN